MKSTMTLLREERDSLKLRLLIRDCVYWPCLAAVVAVAILKYRGMI